MKRRGIRYGFLLPVICAALLGGVLPAETCTTQSAMKASDRDALVQAGETLAGRVLAGDANGLRVLTVPEYVRDFGALQTVVSSTAASTKGGSPQVSSVYLLDATTMTPAPGSAPGSTDAQFFCTLNRSASEVDLIIPGLTPGMYGFVITDVQGGPAGGFELSFLLRREPAGWRMVGFYPHATQSAGHDGLWFWKEARQMLTRNERWNAWLFLGQADTLLRPVGFLQSSHGEKLRDEIAAAAPPALSGGIGPDVPLVVRGPNNAEFRFTSLGVDDSLGNQLDVAAHLRVDAPAADALAARKRNADAAAALVAAYPELRKSFHGVWIFADAAGQPSFGTEQPMTELR